MFNHIAAVLLFLLFASGLAAWGIHYIIKRHEMESDLRQQIAQKPIPSGFWGRLSREADERIARDYASRMLWGGIFLLLMSLFFFMLAVKAAISLLR